MAAAHPRTGAPAKRWLLLTRVRLPGARARSAQPHGRCATLHPVPADILAATAPAMRAKGRIRVGADADIVAFDPDVITDRATYTHLEASFGVQHLLVAGSAVVDMGELVLDALPGRAIVGNRG